MLIYWCLFIAKFVFCLRAKDISTQGTTIGDINMVAESISVAYLRASSVFDY